MILTRTQNQAGGMFGITKQLIRKASYLRTTLKEWEVWRNNSFIWFWFFWYMISHILTRIPHKGYNIIFWNWEYNYYKEVAIPFKDMMKRKQKFIGGIFVTRTSWEKLPFQSSRTSTLMFVGMLSTD